MSDVEIGRDLTEEEIQARCENVWNILFRDPLRIDNDFSAPRAKANVICSSQAKPNPFARRVSNPWYRQFPPAPKIERIEGAEADSVSGYPHATTQFDPAPKRERIEGAEDDSVSGKRPKLLEDKCEI